VATRSPYLDSVREALLAQPSFSFSPDRDLPPPEGTADADSGPRVLFVGFPSDYSLAFLLELLQLDVEVCGIVTSPGAHPAILGENALSRIADHLRIPLLRTWRINDEHSRVDLAALRPEGAVMASFDQIVHAPTLRIPVHGFMNIHPSLLPHYRGPEPVYWAIADGAEEAGITLHRAVPKVDAGPILAQRAEPVRADDTSGTLTRRLAGLGMSILGEAVDGLLGDAPGVIPDLANGSYRPSIGHRRLEEAPSAAAAERMVRAGIPNMPAWTVVEGRPRYVLSARVEKAAAKHRSDATGLSFEDGDLVLVATSPSCHCHHDVENCPHREGPDPG
jgi:methionyl-tRNA formyltransferase